MLEHPSRLSLYQTAMSTYETTRQETDEPTPDHLDADDVTIADTGAGLLVYAFEREYNQLLGREVETTRQLLGFADVTDWDAVTAAVRARGHGHGDVLTLPEFDREALPDVDTEA